MSMRYFCCFFILCVSQSCHQKANHPSGDKTKTPVSSPKQAAAADSGGILNFPCAVVIDPTDEKLNQLKKENGDDFYTIADDNQFYIGSDLMYLDSVHCKVINVQAKGAVAFKTATGRLIKKSLSKYDWALLLFNGKDEPIEADIMTFGPQYERYMKGVK